MTSLNVYVATYSFPIEWAEGWMAKVRESGHRITFDWTVPVREAGSGSPDDAGIRRAAALADLRGVESADVVWLIQPEATSTSTGAWVELGFALAHKEAAALREGAKRPLIMVSGESKKCIFADLADMRFLSHDDAFEYLKGMGK
jgi:nucleoside 2-deoxyribosyltransferase